MVELPEVVDYLLSRGLIERRAVVEAGVVVRDVSSRNRNYQVRVASGGGVHLKLGTSPDGRMAVAREAQVYVELSSLSSALPEAMPPFYGYDPDAGVLALGLLAEAEDLRSYHVRAGAPDFAVAAAIGEALATVHNVGAPVTSSNDPVALPSFFWVYRPTVELFRNASAANLALIRIVQASTSLSVQLDELRHGLRRECLVHNDIKWDNILLSGEGARFVDWENALFGDPAWDVGSAFGQYLSWWLYSIPASEGAPAANFSELAAQPLAGVQMSLNALWTSYFVARQLNVQSATEVLRRAVALTGVRLLQSAYEASQFATQLTSNDILHLQLGANILERPDTACQHLLGLPLRPVP